MTKKKVAIVQYPGTNCEYDCLHIFGNVVAADSKLVWHTDRIGLDEFDIIVIPGGFTHGDYLRAGAMTVLSPITEDIINYADAGKPVIGICNGFQVLCEAGLLPGALLTNQGLLYECRDVYMRLERLDTPFTRLGEKGQTYRMPISHQQGCYFIDQPGLEQLKSNSQIVFRYADGPQKIDGPTNPNGSIDDIAGICNKKGNVVGLMPHPDRCAEAILGHTDGLFMFESAITDAA